MNNFPDRIKAYRPVALCGRGAYGAVYLVADAVGMRYALKIVHKSADRWEREFRGLKNYKTQVPEHPNLIRIFHIEDCGDFFYYTMEAADNFAASGGYKPATLANLIRARYFSAETLREIFDSLLDGLEHLHAAKVIHRDIKPDNIIFVNGVPKFGDIGLIDTANHTLSLAGTALFLPPEYLLGRSREPTPDIDLYALGKTLYCAISGNEADQFPFVPRAMLKSPDCRALNKLVRAACAAEPRMRLKSIEEFRKALHGGVGWGYDLQIGVRAAARRAIDGIATGVRSVFCRRMLIVLLLAVFAVWGGAVLNRRLRRERKTAPPPNVVIAPELPPPAVVSTPKEEAPKPMPPVAVSKPTPPEKKPRPPKAVPKPKPTPLVAPQVHKPKPTPPEAKPQPTVAVPKPKPTPPVAVPKPKPASAPLKHSGKELSRRDYRNVQDDAVECIAKLDALKELVPDYRNLPADEVVIDSFYEHEKGGTVYEFRIPGRKIRAGLRIHHLLYIVYRGFVEFYVGDRKIEY